MKTQSNHTKEEDILMIKTNRLQIIVRKPFISLLIFLISNLNDKNYFLIQKQLFYNGFVKLNNF